MLCAFRDRGIAIDATGGTSIGAIVAAAFARGYQPEAIGGLIRSAVVDKSPVDLTLPTVSFAAGARVTEQIQRGFDGLDLEDLWLNCFCVSTNLTRGALETHTRGEAWLAIRSSFSVPGLFPPMQNDAGDLLVDGGILDNLPIRTMRSTHPGITVVGADVGARKDYAAGLARTMGVVSGWRVLASGLRDRNLDGLMSLPRLLLRLTELGSHTDDDLGDCYIRLTIDGVSLLDFDKFDQLVASGRVDAGRAIDDWLEVRPAVPTAG